MFYQHLQLRQHHSKTKPIKIQLVPATSSSVILEVCRVRVKYEPSIWPHSVNQVDGAPARCLGGHRFNPVRDSDFFVCPMLVTC